MTDGTGLRSRLTNVWELLRDTIYAWSSDNGSQMGAALAYYTFFSLAPLLLIVIALVGFAVGHQAAQGQILDEVKRLIGPQAETAVRWLIRQSQQKGTGALATGLGFATLLVGASGMVNSLQNSFNLIWKAPARAGIQGIVAQYLASYAMVLGLGFLSLVSLLLTTAFSAISKYLGDILPFSEPVMHIANFILSFAGVTCLFAFMLRWIPSVRPPWKDIWPGAAFTAFLFVIGKLVLGLYLGRKAVGSLYGAAGSIVIILLWVYYSAQILYIGVEFTKIYSERRRQKPVVYSPHRRRMLQGIR